MADRSLSFDLLVKDRGSVPLERFGRAADRARHKVSEFNTEGAKADGTSTKLDGRVKKLGASALGMARGIGIGASAVSTLAAVAIPAAVGLTNAAFAVAHFTAEVGPAAAALLPLAAGAGLVTLTAKAMGPAMLTAVEPVTKAWTKQGEAVGRLASRGLPALARQFVKVNFPAIEKNTNRIAKSTNEVVRFIGNWVNGAAGQEVIAKITGDTADTFDRLKYSVTGVVISAALLAGRVSGTAFKNFGDAAEYSMDKLNGFMDRISGPDVERAFDRIKSTGRTVIGVFRGIGDALSWVRDNQDTLNRVADGAAVLSLAMAPFLGPVGLITGGIAALSLLIRHWGTVTDVWDRARAKLSELAPRFTSLQGPVDAAREAGVKIKAAFLEFVDQVKPHLQPFLDKLGVTFIKMQPWITGVISVTGTLMAAWFRLAGPVLGGVIDGLGLLVQGFGYVITWASQAAVKILSAFSSILGPIATAAEKFKLPFAGALRELVTGSKSASDRMQKSLDQVKTDLAQKKIDDLQKKVNSLEGKSITIQTDFRTTGVNKSNYADYKAFQVSGVRAKGGPVTKGQAYVVGDGGRPELFVPNESGTILPEVPSQRTRVPQVAGGSGGGAITVHLTVQGNVVADEGFRRMVASAVSDGVRRGRR